MVLLWFLAGDARCHRGQASIRSLATGPPRGIGQSPMAAKGGTDAGDRPVPVLGRLLTAAASLSDDRRCRSSVRNAARARRPARGPPPRRRPRPTRRHPPHARQCQRGENRIRRARRRTGPLEAADRRSGLRCQPPALRPEGGRHHRGHPRHALAQAPDPARQATLPGSLADRGTSGGRVNDQSTRPCPVFEGQRQADR